MVVDSERRDGGRYLVSLPIRVKWEAEGEEIVEDGLTENVGPKGVLVHLPRMLPNVGSIVHLTIMEEDVKNLSLPAEVLRLERNASHPQAAFQVIDEVNIWEEKVWDGTARRIFESIKPEEYDDF